MKAFSRLSLLLSVGLCACQSPAGTSDVGATAAGSNAPITLAIGQVQGVADRSTYVGQQVSVEGVVVGNFSQGLGGVFIQSLTPDDNEQSSEGLFVERSADAEPRLHLGDHVRAIGTVSESGRGDATITALSDARVQVLGRADVSPVVIRQAASSAGDWERHEGMALRIEAPLTVSGTDALGRYGEITASFGGRLFQPTELAAPGPGARKIADDNARRRLLLDDARSSENPNNLWFLRDGLADATPLRTGSVLRMTAGILDQRHGRYRLQLTEKLDVAHAERPLAPTLASDDGSGPGPVLRVASLNLLNLFNGDGLGGGYPTPRGAENPAQQQMQLRKLVAVVQALQPDVAALMEMENDGYGPESALAQFVAALNKAGPIRDYRFIDAAEGLGSDQIRVALVYRAGRVVPQGRPATLSGGPFVKRSRVPLAQAFKVGKGPVFVVVANHFKSKGCGREAEAATGAEADQGDGQSCWNPLRIESAKAVNAWLQTDPTASGSDLTMILGDLNAYGEEDPLRLLRAAGWRDAFAVAKVDRPYSYVYTGLSGRLDHALLSAALAGRLRGAAEWHNNADEAELFDYRADAEGDTWRASDHDPILLAFDLTRE